MKQLAKILLIVTLVLIPAVGQPEVEITVLAPGMGPAIQDGQIAVVAYKLTLEDDTLVEKTSVRHPFTFTLGSNKVIPGLSQGVKGMKVSEKRLLKVPSELAYGDKDVGYIPANSTLLFTIELLQIMNEEAQEAKESASDEADEVDLKDRFKDERFLDSRHAEDITKPAMFEYLIRDFFTKPWRYEDGPRRIWRSTAETALPLVILIVIALVGHKKRKWIL